MYFVCVCVWGGGLCVCVCLCVCKHVCTGTFAVMSKHGSRVFISPSLYIIDVHYD